MKNLFLLLLLLTSSACFAQINHVKTTDAEITYIVGFNLNKMNEPDLYNDTSSNEIYRFIWIRSFHKPMIVRIEKSKDVYTLYWKIWSGAGGYNWGKPEADAKKIIEKETWNKFFVKLKKADFAKMSTKTDFRGFDGAEWILEGKTVRQHNIM